MKYLFVHVWAQNKAKNLSSKNDPSLKQIEDVAAVLKILMCSSVCGNAQLGPETATEQRKSAPNQEKVGQAEGGQPGLPGGLGGRGTPNPADRATHLQQRSLEIPP